MAERLAPAMVRRFTSRISERLPSSPSVTYGRYDIHLGDSTELVFIRTPQGTVLLVGVTDLIVERVSRESGQVVQEFKVSNLPEGYSMMHGMKGDRI